jgi:hypothetical protein
MKIRQMLAAAGAASVALSLAWIGSADAVSAPAQRGNIAGQLRDAALNPGGSPAHAPLEGACAVAFDEEGFGGEWHTSSTGRYKIRRLLEGDYPVFFHSCYDTSGDYAWQTYKGQFGFDYANATEVHVTPGQTTQGITDRLTLGGSISGTFTDLNGDPVEGVLVIPSLPENNVQAAAAAFTDDAGFMQIHAIRAGQVSVDMFKTGCSAPSFDVAVNVAADTDVSTVLDCGAPAVASASASKTPKGIIVRTGNRYRIT